MNNKIKIWVLWEWLDDETQNWLEAKGEHLKSEDVGLKSSSEQWEIPIQMPRQIAADLASAMAGEGQKAKFRQDTWHVSLSDHPFAEDFIDVVGEPFEVDNTPNDSHKILRFPLKTLLFASDDAKEELLKVGEFL
jgi:hypothetical protein